MGLVLSHLNCEKQIVQTEHETHLLLWDQSKKLQLVVDQPISLDEKVHFDISFPAPAFLQQQSLAISSLARLIKYGQFTKSCHRKPRKKFASIDALHALDLHDEGLSLRQIAANLFGEQAVEESWNGLSDNLKSRTRYLVNKGKRLRAQGQAPFFMS